MACGMSGTARQTMLVLRSGAHLALEHKIITSKQVEGALDILSRDTIEPKSRDELCAFRLKMSEIGFPYIPANQFWRIEKPGLLANSFEGCKEFVHPVPIVPRGSDDRSVKRCPVSLLIIPGNVDECHALRRKRRNKRIHHVIVLEGITSPYIGTGQGDAGGKIGDLHACPFSMRCSCVHLSCLAIGGLENQG